MKTYVKDIDKDEIRSGFLVTTDRKKIWNKEIEMLVEIDRICKKHDIKYIIFDEYFFSKYYRETFNNFNIRSF